MTEICIISLSGERDREWKYMYFSGHRNVPKGKEMNIKLMTHFCVLVLVLLVLVLILRKPSGIFTHFKLSIFHNPGFPLVALEE